MPLTAHEDRIALEGHCAVEEAEALLERLLERPGTPVDLSAATAPHTALVQVLLALAPPVAAWPGDAALARALRAALGDAPTSD